MNETLAQVMEKAAKLLRLSKSDNPNEAALAASKAQELIDRYKLNMSDVNLDGAAVVESNEPIMDFGHDPLTNDNQIQRWKAYLSMGIAKVNQCKVICRGKDLCLIGRPSDVQVCRYTFSWLVAEIERLANRDCLGCGRNFFNNFRIGAVETINRRLKEQQEKTIQTVKCEALAVSTYALAVVTKNALTLEKREQEVESWMQRNMNLKKRQNYATKTNHTAREMGRKAGEGINLAARGNLGTSQQYIA